MFCLRIAKKLNVANFLQMFCEIISQMFVRFWLKYAGSLPGFAHFAENQNPNANKF